MTSDPKRLLGGYATDSLTEAERRELLRAALDDQAVFDALVEEEDLRELLQDPAGRQEVLAVLEQQTAWERLRAWFERPATLLDLAGAAALVLVALGGYAVLAPAARPVGRTPAAARPLGTPLSTEQVAALLALPEQQSVSTGIEIAGRPDAVFAPGEPVHVRIKLRAPARVAVLEEVEGGAARQVWPGLNQPPALVLPPASRGPAIRQLSLEAPHAPGTHRLRLVVAPADLDIGALFQAALRDVAGRLSLADVRYEVTRR